MSLTAFTSLIKELLDLPLPGNSAQQMLMPYPVGVKKKSMKRFEESNLDGAKKSGVMILFYEKEGEIYFPLIKRPEYDGAHSGQVSFPGGKHELSDSDIVHTAVRETNEEIGVPTHHIEILGRITDLFIDVSNFLVSPVLAFSEHPMRFVPDAIEVDRVIEVPVRAIIEGPIDAVELDVRGFKLQAPHFDIENEVVWGATAMMLGELRQLLLPYKNVFL